MGTGPGPKEGDRVTLVMEGRPGGLAIACAPGATNSDNDVGPLPLYDTEPQRSLRKLDVVVLNFSFILTLSSENSI